MSENKSKSILKINDTTNKSNIVKGIIYEINIATHTPQDIDDVNVRK